MYGALVLSAACSASSSSSLFGWLGKVGRRPLARVDPQDLARSIDSAGTATCKREHQPKERITMKHRRSKSLLAIPIAAALVLAACGDDDDDAADTAAPAADTRHRRETTAAADSTPAETTPPAERRQPRPRQAKPPLPPKAERSPASAPRPSTIQTDWNPEAEHGFLYQMIGEDYAIDKGKASRDRFADRPAGERHRRRASRSAPEVRPSASRPSRRSCTPTTTSCSATSTPTRRSRTRPSSRPSRSSRASRRTRR